MTAHRNKSEVDLKVVEQAGAPANLNLLLNRREALKLGAALMASGGLASAEEIRGSNSVHPSGEQPPTEMRLASTSPIFPNPQEIEFSGRPVRLDEATTVLIPANPSENDRLCATLLTEDVSDRFGLTLQLQCSDRLPESGNFIVMGEASSPLVQHCGARRQLALAPENPGPDGYVLHADENLVIAKGSDARGTFYGLQSLRQLICLEDRRVQVKGVKLRDWPDKPFRGIKLFLPGRNNIPFFKRFVRDFMALHKYNALIVQLNASMRLERHPELNRGWVKFAQDTTYSRRNYPPGIPHGIEQNATHQDLADGEILDKDEVAELARYVRRFHIDFIPEIPSFTHSYYLLSEHKDLSEVPGEKWPDTFCPSNPESYKLLFDVFDEYIEVLKPTLIHIGHDELFIPLNQCPRCGARDIGERYGMDVRKTHDYLASKGVQLAIWGDMLLEGVRGKGPQKRSGADGWSYYTPGGMTRVQVERLIPKDILIFNWFWNWDKAEESEETLDEMGFRQVYGNLTPQVGRYQARKARTTLLGGAPSAWFAVSEFGFGKDLLADFLGCSNLLWGGHVLGKKDLSRITLSLLPDIRVRLRGEVPPSQREAAIAPVEISASHNHGPLIDKLGVDVEGMSTGSVEFRKMCFELGAKGANCITVVATDGAGPSGLPKEVAPIRIGQDATSLLFLHASARPATNKGMFRLIWDPEDTADLLGWYEVIYEDGFVTTIAIRYGVNIMEWDWGNRGSANDYCYGADAIAIGCAEHPITFFAFEWKSPRIGKVIREIRLKGTTGFRGGPAGFTNDYGPVIANNAVMLKAISVVMKRSNG